MRCPVLVVSLYWTSPLLYPTIHFLHHEALISPLMCLLINSTWRRAGQFMESQIWFKSSNWHAREFEEQSRPVSGRHEHVTDWWVNAIQTWIPDIPILGGLFPFSDIHSARFQVQCDYSITKLSKTCSLLSSCSWSCFFATFLKLLFYQCRAQLTSVELGNFINPLNN